MKGATCMELLQQIIAFARGTDVQDLLAAYLMILGGLKVIARISPWKFDDQLVELLGKPVDLIKKVVGEKKQ
jgi:hypothetical protein